MAAAAVAAAGGLGAEHPCLPVFHWGKLCGCLLTTSQALMAATYLGMVPAAPPTPLQLLHAQAKELETA